MDYDVAHRLEKVESQKEQESLGDFKRLLQMFKVDICEQED